MKVTNYQNATIDPFGKGLGMVPGTGIQLNDASRLQWNLLEEDVSLPAAVLYSDRIEHNLKWMQDFVGEYGVKLAPHGKTTMAPQLFRRQLDTGAWGITLATAHQVRAAYRGGVHRVLMANQLVGKRNMGMIAELLTDASFEFFCLVDSADGVDQLGEFFSSVRKKLNVLIELGVPGGRTGVRDDAQRDAVLAAIARWNGTIELAGIELYEGVLQDETKVREFLKSAVDVTRKLIGEGKIARKPAILSGAGSAWYDVVADEFAKANSDAIEVVLRPGCYLTHDVGIYKKAQNEIFARNPIAKKMGQGLKPALQLWAYVQSIPEPDRAIIGLGKRDSAFDAGMPEPAKHYRPGNEAPRDVSPDEGWEIFGLMDQHAYLRIKPGDDVKVGDMIAFDISHPCLTFDKWRQILVVDPKYRVTEVIETFF
ncbi:MULTISPECIES: amino acid deaminase [Caballeronia]|uniref:amino acid deaminase n=1 Tax=Caballeronia TaxID=1827195 RepID=UPI00025BC181|nr:MULTISPECIES: amino acid deaminase [Caballeronia]EKS68821.1 alanine racemase [Burkholderia sp. SJ98]MCG7399404.1 amino acid deaminase [Caballeronia zhejiangensis]MCI1042071.1 amino acid deaminase [Caballeronia zhejiangensis]MDR5764099.1 amino acid deaminase [Caballeronia sp. LZ028]MDR5785650.1 amino acid deaminase [Caballeronia sp. LP003]